MADPYDISDVERCYWVKNNDGLRAQQIASLKSVITWVREHRDLIDTSIHEALGGQPIRHDVGVVDYADRSDDTGGTES